MRASRRLLGLTLGLVLIGSAAACGNDAPTVQPTQTQTATTAPTETAAEPTAAEPTATDTAASGEAAVSLADLCAEEYADVQAPEGFSVGLVTDIGRVDDGTFNQFAYEGMKAAEECFGFTSNVIETAAEADYERNLATILAEDPAVVVTVGFLLADATEQVAGENPEVSFIGVDQFRPEFPDNYIGILFREDQGGFLAGALAGLLTESDVVGVVGGREDVPPVVRFVNGFGAGVAHTNPDARVLSTYLPSFTDQAAGRSAAEQFLGEGADVIFGAGGQTGSGAIKAAAEAGAWAIGVDQDEYFTTFSGGSAPGSERLASSAVKRVDLGVFTQIAEAVQGTFSGGIFELTAENGGITYAPFHDADVPADVQQQLEEVRQGLADGSIETGVDPVTGLPE